MKYSREWLKVKGQNIKFNTNLTPYRDAAIVVEQLAQGLKVLHEQNIIVCDVTLDNVYYDSPLHNVIKIVSFGRANVIPPGDHVYHSNGVHPPTSPPEVLLHGQITTGTDVWVGFGYVRAAD